MNDRRRPHGTLAPFRRLPIRKDGTWRRCRAAGRMLSSSKAIDLANGLPLSAGEFAVGRKWAGFIDPLRVDFSGQPLQDFVEISAAFFQRVLPLVDLGPAVR